MKISKVNESAEEETIVLELNSESELLVAFNFITRRLGIQDAGFGSSEEYAQIESELTPDLH